MADWETLDTDWLIIGGGAAGVMAAVRARELRPDLKVTVVEKAHVNRSGCLAAGVNAINAYLNPGETPESFLDYVKEEFAGLVREDLVLTMAARLNEMTGRLEGWGLPILKDPQGRYVARGRASIRINGEAIKPIMARALVNSGATVLNHTAATGLFMVEERVAGALVFGLKDGVFRAIRAKAVILATGGAAGLYRPNNPGEARHKMWYSPFNTGAGLAMAYRAGAELTSLEMRFVALRVKDTFAPTGTLAQGVSAPQINANDEKYLHRYSFPGGKPSTADRLWATLEEIRQGRGPCCLDTRHLTDDQAQSLKAAYLNMCPTQVLQWADKGVQPNQLPVEITGSEPYIVGGHGMAGLWVDSGRKTTLPGLYAAGDIAGGAPKKYVTGSMAEGALAVEASLPDMELPEIDRAGWRRAAEEEYRRAAHPLASQSNGESPQALEEVLQDLMDRYAGGISQGYVYDREGLQEARRGLRELAVRGLDLAVGDPYELMLVHQVWDRILLAQALVEHMDYREESRWPVYQTRRDFPLRDDRRWRVFVNSRLTAASQIQVYERPLLEKAGEAPWVS